MAMRILLVIHRYLGVVIGLVMALWCLSGFVMMYQGYPRLTPDERLRGMEALRLDGCCDAVGPRLGEGLQVSGFRIEMLSGRPVLRVSPNDGPERLFDLRTSQAITAISPVQALGVARAFAAGNAVGGSPRPLGLIDKDQWTLEDAARRGPVYHFSFDDPSGRELYVAARTGLAVQDSTRTERLWSWFGAVPHWLYPTVLRQNVPLWSSVVVWTSLIGCFLTVTGLYVGIARFRRYGGGRWSPYRGWFYWHHIAGLIFGLFTLTWVASGMFTMNPWGFLDTPVGEAEQQRLAGQITGPDVVRFLAVAPKLAGPKVVQLKAEPLSGRLFVMATNSMGRSVRYDASARPAPLSREALRSALGAVGPLAVLTRLDHEDAYYYAGYERTAVLPVYRASFADRQATTLYLDADSGELTQALDQTARQSRWLRTGLHDLDFGWMRGRPIWDVIVLTLLAGVTVGCVTGAWLGLQRLQRDVAGLFRRR